MCVDAHAYTLVCLSTQKGDYFDPPLGVIGKLRNSVYVIVTYVTLNSCCEHTQTHAHRL